MATVDIAAFQNDREAIALAVSRERLPGLFGKRLTVPEGMLAHVRRGADREEKLLAAGESEQDEFDGVLVKISPVEVAFSFSDLRTREGFDLACELRATLAFRPAAIDLGQFRENVFLDRERFAVADLRAFLAPYVRDAIRVFASARDAVDLVDLDCRRAVLDHMHGEMEKPFFVAGLDLRDVQPPAFSSRRYEQGREQALAERARREDMERKQKLDEFEKRLRAEGVIRELEIVGEVDKRRADAQIQRWEEIRKRMGEDDTKALVLLLEDEDLKAKLIRKLVEREMTPEQRERLKVDEVEERLSAQLREFQEKLHDLAGGELAAPSGPPTRRLLCVIGKRVLAFDPKTNLNPDVPKEVHDTSAGALGYLRSVRVQRLDGRELFLIGAQRGVYVRDGDDLREYRFPSEPKDRGGANGACIAGGHIFATHSEVGLIRWDVARIGQGEVLHPDITKGNSSTRGAMLGDDGRLYFSSGNSVYALDALRGGKLTTFKGSTDSITAFIVVGDDVIAGNKIGQLLKWNVGDPNSPVEMPVKKSNPIYMLRAVDGKEKRLVIGSKDYAVTTQVLGKEKFQEYRAREEVRWVDGASDFVFGVSRSGYKAFVWDVRRPTEPSLTIRVADRIQDIFVVRERATGGETA